MFTTRSLFVLLYSVIGMLWTCAVASSATPAMAPMDQIGPQPRSMDIKSYAHIIHVSPGGKHQTVAGALAAVTDASPAKRYAILVAAGTYKESRIQMKAYVDLYGGFGPDNWKERDIYQHAAILDAHKKGPVLLGADHARLDGFVITGGEQKGHGAGILCKGVSPIIVNNVITRNHTLKPDTLRQGLGKQEASEGAGIALLSGSHAYVSNNLICNNSTDAGAGAGLTARGKVTAKVLRNVFCNNTSGLKDDTMFHGKVGSRSSPGAAIACNAESSPQISFNVIVLGTALFKNDAGGIWVEGNSMPRINYNWIAGNTSYDDGGGIYVMGNLYYDDERMRHDLAPDGPVRIEGNIIAGNKSVYGGPAGVRVSRFGRVELRRNLIVANDVGGAAGGESGLICVLENNIIADNGVPGKKARKQAPKPSFRLAGDITARKFDARRYVTEIVISKALGKEDLSASVVRIGGQWSIVQSSGPGSLTIWGKITDKAARFEILDRYQTSK